jgi:ribosomal protein S18 acetylase RimI-like enzyme
MNPVIRPATIDDMDSLVSLMNYLLSIDGDFPNSEENQRRGFEMVINSDKAWVFVIESAGKIEGMCSMFSFISTVQGGYVGMIEDVVVKEEVAGQGLGQQLLEYAEKFAIEKGLSRLQLMVDKDNETARSFYEKMDWEKTSFIGYRKYI